ncbi:MAG: DNA repair protein RecN [Erysipelotrichaceae bacterium]|nr:DNA repair protein RecN [Erysipelotrichaceae bacterium]
MLEQLNIKNLAIIDDLSIDFEPGFTVLTGETGAGKSIIIDGIGLLLGNRMNSSLIRTGASKAYVEGCFRLSDFNRQRLLDFDIEDDLLVISKDLYADGRSITKVNGRIVPLSTLREISAYIINIHSQFDNQYLFYPSYHELLLNNFAKNYLEKNLENYQSSYNKYKLLSKELEEIKDLNFDPEVEKDLKNQLNEIENLNLQENEIEELEIEQKRISNFAKLNDKVNEAVSCLDDEKGALETLYYAKRSLELISDDPVFSKYAEMLESIYTDTSELVFSLKRDFDNLDIDPYRLEEITNRISQINRIKNKYGSTYQDIEKAKLNLQQALDNMTNKTIRISELEKELSLVKKQLEDKANVLTNIRQKYALELCALVKKELKDLYLENITIEFKFKKVDFKENGVDYVELYVSFNKGEEIKPLAKVSSGGELSRVMLGLKSIFNKLFNLETIIFDEVDSGVSGRVANAVAEKMKSMSSYLQVICITHLPNVAAIADNHYKVSKQIKNNKTATSILKLNDEERVKEIASMMFGDNVDNSSLETARKMLFK